MEPANTFLDKQMTDAELIEWVRVQLVTVTLTKAESFEMSPDMRNRFYKATNTHASANVEHSNAFPGPFGRHIARYDLQQARKGLKK